MKNGPREEVGRPNRAGYDGGRKDQGGKLEIGPEAIFVMFRELGEKGPKMDQSAFASEAAYVVRDGEIGKEENFLC